LKYLRRAVNKITRDEERPLRSITEEKQLKWYGHAFRMGNERKVKQALEVKVDGKRGRERQINMGGRNRDDWKPKE
jgi:hypothetical protein